MLLDKVKNLELELSVTRKQTNRFASSKLDHMLSIQKSPLNKTGLGFEDSISVSETHSTNFVTSLEPPRVRLSNQEKLHHLLGRLGLILKSLSLRILPSLRIRCMINFNGFVIFVERLGIFTQTVSNCKLQSEQISQKYLYLKYKIL